MAAGEVARTIGISVQDATRALHELRPHGYARDNRRRYERIDRAEMSSSRARPRGPAGLARPADLADAAAVWPRAVSAALPTSRRTDRTFASRRMGSCMHGSGAIPERLSVAPSRKETPCDCFDARQPFLRTASAVRAAPNRCLRGRADAPCAGSTCGRCARPRAWDRRRRREPQVEWPHLGGRGRGPHGRPLRASDAQDARRSVLLFTSTAQWRGPGTCCYSDQRSQPPAVSVQRQPTLRLRGCACRDGPTRAHAERP
jgi:hypothetical protein